MKLELMKEKGREIKLVVFDLDGTLLTSKSEISNKSKEAIKSLRKKGIKVAIASGRIASMLKYFYEDLDLDDFVISSNGACIEDLSINKPIQQLFSDPEDSKKVVEFCVKHHIECNILKREASYFQSYSERVSKFKLYNDHAKEANSEEIEIIYYEDGIADYNNIGKLLIYEMNQKKIEMVKKFVSENTKLTFLSSGIGYLDVCSVGVSKGNAVKKVAEYMGIELEQVCAFGDYDNDISMLEIVGIAIVTANGSENTLKHADYITKSNDDEGIAHAVNEILL